MLNMESPEEKAEREARERNAKWLEVETEEEKEARVLSFCKKFLGRTK